MAVSKLDQTTDYKKDMVVKHILAQNRTTEHKTDNGTQNAHGGETRTSTEPDNGTQNGQGGETRTSTEPDNRTQNGQGDETRSSTEPDSGTQNGQSGETRTVQDNAVQNTESRTRRKKANKDRQYLQDKQDGREKTGRRNPEVAPRLRRRKLHEKEQDVHENEKEEEVVKCQAFLCQEPKRQRQKWIACDKCERWLHFECVGIQRKHKGNYDCGCSIARIERS